ncbi:type VI secretion system baseplate subunit TssG [Legionella pneumophila]
MDAMVKQSQSLIIDKLLSQYKNFDFYQAIRLINHIIAQAKKADVDAQLEIVPWLSLSFPETDILNLEKVDNKFKLTATFLSLFGITSPLPTFYTEELLQHNKHHQVDEIKELLNIIHKRLYYFLYHAWSQNRLLEQFVEQKNETTQQALLGLIGLSLKNIREKIPNHRHLLKYASHWICGRRTLQGLSNFLTDYFNVPVRAQSLFLSIQPIPYEQRCRLGIENHQLASTAYLGSYIQAGRNNLLICIGPLDVSRFFHFLLGGANVEMLKLLLKLYMREPFNYMIEVILDKGFLSALKLSSLAHPLGMVSWLSPTKEVESFKVKYWLK